MFGTPEPTSFKRRGLGSSANSRDRSDLLLTTRVSGLHRGNLLIRDRNGRTTVPLFAHEIEFGRGRMTVQTGLLQRQIDHFIPTVLNRRPLRGYVQCKKLPSVGLGKGGPIMLVDGRSGKDRLCKDYDAPKQRCRHWDGINHASKKKLASSPTIAAIQEDKSK